jgi:hypothetical protein
MKDKTKSYDGIPVPVLEKKNFITRTLPVFREVDLEQDPQGSKTFCQIQNSRLWIRRQNWTGTLSKIIKKNSNNLIQVNITLKYCTLI